MNLRKIVVFVAGPYNGDIKGNIAKARKVALVLWEMGFTVFCPHLNTAHFEVDCKIKDDEYIKGDLVILERCDVLFMVPEWESSKGALGEHQRAAELLIPIFEEKDALLDWAEQWLRLEELKK